jgi:beta-phosphoglucomutase
MPGYDAVLFDFDGVLADTEPLHFACWASAVAPLGIRLDWETYRRFGVGSTDAGLMRLIASLANPPVTPELIASKYLEKRMMFLERAQAESPISEAVAALVKSLEGYGLAVVTSSYLVEVQPLLVRAGIFDRFGALVAAGDVLRAKPWPDPYLQAANRLGARAPLVVEDSEPGVASARAAGFDVVQVRSPAEVPKAVRGALGEAVMGRRRKFR